MAIELKCLGVKTKITTKLSNISTNFPCRYRNFCEPTNNHIRIVNWVRSVSVVLFLIIQAILILICAIYQLETRLAADLEDVFFVIRILFAHVLPLILLSTFNWFILTQKTVSLRGFLSVCGYTECFKSPANFFCSFAYENQGTI